MFPKDSTEGLAKFINKLRQNLTSAKYVIMETRRNYGGNSLDTSSAPTSILTHGLTAHANLMSPVSLPN